MRTLGRQWDAAQEARREKIKAMPDPRFVFERDWMRGPNDFWLGVMWDKDIDAEPGTMCYRKWWMICLKFRLLIDRSHAGQP